MSEKNKFFYINLFTNFSETSYNIFNYFLITPPMKAMDVFWESLLDIGCAMAYYFPELQKRVKNVEGIDISSKAIEVAHERGFTNTKVADIMNYTADKTYDTLTLVWNNLSIWGDIAGTHKLIGILKNLLKKDGKMLCIFRKIEEEYFISSLCIEFNGLVSEPFQWIRIRLDLLSKLLLEHGLKVKILAENDYGYCLEIRNK